ncbi:unnamed protein product [Brachionus calyciflorus]|uniref:O(6)-methylguanine-induced apoptosis 2 n=1 Tax=Brachionus calyciflorus TaxID=104777 RepID=A0A813V0E3_9BILA|nr:unnamed protein product [Brachionus calyciflorus]
MSAAVLKDSIEVLSNDFSKRSPDRKGKLFKGNIFSSGSVPTIPSKFFTVITDNSDNKGFHRTSKRFQYNFSDTPGPGSYVSQDDASQKLKKPSDSKKGYGGFASSSSRDELKFNPLITPGAGSYELSTTNNRKDFSNSNSSSFHRPIAQKLEKSGSLPAPNAYDLTNLTKFKFKNNNVHADSAFRSQTKREFIQIDKNVPGPNVYNVNDNLKHDNPKVIMSSFKSSTNRRSFTPHNNNPGPGDYNPNEANTENVNRQLFPRRHYLAISAPAVPMPTELPQPGPGAYNVRDFKEPEKKYMSSAVFVSSTSRYGAQIQNFIPGPANYSPEKLTKQSFLYNLDRKWV